MSRAFNAWGENNANIKFIDVTSECQSLGMNHYDETHRGPPSLVADGQDYAVQNGGRLGFHGGCPLAEIWVTRLTAIPTEEEGISVAEAHVLARFTDNFYFTNGQQLLKPGDYDGAPAQARRSLEVYAGTLSIRTDGMIESNSICWYLDSKFCYNFHRLKKDMDDTSGSKALISAICWLVSLSAGIYLVFIQFHALTACCGYQSAGKRDIDRDGDGDVTCSERFYAVVEEMADWNPLVFAIVISLVLAPIMLLYAIFLPCWDCADFEAAMLHEVGHFLALGHPDNLPTEVLENAATYNAVPITEAAGLLSFNALLAAGEHFTPSSCLSSWADVATGVPMGATGLEKSSQGYLYRGSVMEAFTQHNPRACLMPDDVEALSVLYPDCSNSTSMRGGVVTCHQVNHNIGLIRVTAFVVFPLLFGLIFIVLFSSFIHCYKSDELEEARLKSLQAEKKVQAMEELYRNGPPPSARKKYADKAAQYRQKAKDALSKFKKKSGSSGENSSSPRPAGVVEVA